MIRRLLLLLAALAIAAGAQTLPVTFTAGALECVLDYNAGSRQLNLTCTNTASSTFVGSAAFQVPIKRGASATYYTDDGQGSGVTLLLRATIAGSTPYQFSSLVTAEVAAPEGNAPTP